MVQRCGMHPLQAVAAVSVNAARTTPHPSGIPHGIIAEGAAANFNIVDGEHWESMALRPSSSPFSATVLNGQFIRIDCICINSLLYLLNTNQMKYR